MKVTELEQKETFPAPRSGHRLVAVCDYIVLFGGYNNKPVLGGELKKEVWCYHTLTECWKLILTDCDQFPSSAASCAVVALDTKLIVFGGSGAHFGHTNSNGLHVLDMKTLKWEKVMLSGSLIEGGFGHSISLDTEMNHLYLYGGCDGYHYFNTMNKICLKTWHNENFYRHNYHGIYRHESINYENKIMIFGGGNPSAQVDLGTIPYFCTVTKTWHVVHANSKDNPRGRLAHSCNKINHYVIVMGGQTKKDDNSFGNYALSDIWLFNLNTQSWTELMIVLPERIFFHSAAVSHDEHIYLFGGSKYESSGSVERLNCLYKVSIFVPSLVELVWDYVRKTLVRNVPQPQLEHIMHEIGVPAYFIDLLSSI